MSVLDHLELVADSLLRGREPIGKVLRVANSGGEGNDRARRHQKELLPDDTILGLANGVNFIENDALHARAPGVGVRRREEQDLQNVRHSDKDLAALRVVDPVITSVDCPDTLATVLVRFRVTSLHFSSNLVDKRLGWGNVNKHTIVIGVEDFAHRVERDERLTGTGWRHNEHTLVRVDAVEHATLPTVGLELDTVVGLGVEASLEVRTAVHQLELLGLSRDCHRICLGG